MQSGFLNQPVILPSVLASAQFLEDDALEPQMVQRRHNNSAIVVFDSADRNPFPSNATPFNDNSLSSRITLTGGILAQRHKRHAINKLSFFWQIPNLNPRTNVVPYFLNGSTATLFTAVIPEGFYNYTTFAPALQTALNAVAPVGFTFTVSTVPQPNRIYQSYTISVAGPPPSTFMFSKNLVDNALMANFGLNLVPLPIAQVFSTSKQTGTWHGYYTTLVYILSDQLTTYNKNSSGTTGFGSATNLLYTLELPNNLDPTAPSTNRFIDQPSSLYYFNWKPSQNITNTDFQLLDEWRQPLYIPSPFDGAEQNANFRIHLQTEL